MNVVLCLFVFDSFWLLDWGLASKVDGVEVLSEGLGFRV